MNSKSPNPAGAVDAPMSFLFHRVHHRRRATDQQRSATAHAIDRSPSRG